MPEEAIPEHSVPYAEEHQQEAPAAPSSDYTWKVLSIDVKDTRYHQQVVLSAVVEGSVKTSDGYSATTKQKVDLLVPDNLDIEHFRDFAMLSEEHVLGWAFQRQPKESFYAELEQQVALLRQKYFRAYGIFLPWFVHP